MNEFEKNLVNLQVHSKELRRILYNYKTINEGWNILVNIYKKKAFILKIFYFKFYEKTIKKLKYILNV